jgi:Ca-activated chloride channel family protein
MIETIGQFHFLRPWWLLALLPAAGVLWMVAKRTAASRSWDRIVDAHLLRVLLGAPSSAQRRGLLVLFGAALAVAVVALAGPTWSQAPQATYRAQNARVVVLSLAPTMDAGDVAPSRLVRARLKVLDLLARQREGQTALIAYSGEPFVVAPLTEDARTIAALVPVLSVDLMPVPGDKLSAALHRAGELLAQANAGHGDIVVIGDSAGDAPAMQAAAALRDAGHRVSVLAVGLGEGAPVPIRGGGFLKDASGAIIVHKVDATALGRLADSGGGAMAMLSTDDSDLATVLAGADPARAAPELKSDASTVSQWRDEGPWLVLVLLPLAALLFRRGWLVAIAALAVGVAPDASHAFELEQLWLRSDQRAARALHAEEYARAAELAEGPMQKGEALFRARKFEEAAEAFAKVDTPDGDYNRGNALAKAGRYADALAAYQAALRRIPTHADAKYNRALIEELLKRDPPPQSGGQQQPQAGQKPQEQSQPSSQSASAQDRGGAEDRNSGTGESDNRSRGEQPKDTPDRNASSARDEREQREAESAQAKSGPAEAEAQDAKGATDGASVQDREAQQAAEQFLGRVPDDPGGLLREKFRREYLRRLKREAGESE